MTLNTILPYLAVLIALGSTLLAWHKYKKGAVSEDATFKQKVNSFMVKLEGMEILTSKDCEHCLKGKEMMGLKETMTQLAEQALQNKKELNSFMLSTAKFVGSTEQALKQMEETISFLRSNKVFTMLSDRLNGKNQ
ncbi:MAG: hypothetical protein KAQ85_07620 [Thermodesulfovibrionia bacterium]|nr:hypothetical protein [Thermodesulfovibrionia bacterium]